jgi:hypothetical protein
MALPARGREGAARKPLRIQHKQILTVLQGPLEDPGNLAGIYRLRVLPVKTRTIQLLGRKGPARVIETLLGYEVQGSYKRINCPDLVTARYLKLFLELGCRSIKVPYDPTVTAAILPAMEASLAALQEAIRKMVPAPAPQQLYVIRQVCRHLREQLKSRPEPVSPTEQSD